MRRFALPAALAAATSPEGAAASVCSALESALAPRVRRLVMLEAVGFFPREADTAADSLRMCLEQDECGAAYCPCVGAAPSRAPPQVASHQAAPCLPVAAQGGDRAHGYR